MKKRNVDELAVESFDAESGQERPRGTVNARADTEFLCVLAKSGRAGCDDDGCPDGFRLPHCVL